MKVRIITVRYNESDIQDGALPHGVYDDAMVEDIPVDNAEEAAELVARYGLNFAATGGSWAADPNGSRIVSHYSGDLEEVSAHLIGFTLEDEATVHDLVG